MTTATDVPNGEGAAAPEAGSGGPAAFSEEEIAAVTGAPSELDELEPAEIEETPDLESSFEKLVQKSKRLSSERVRTVVQSVLFVAPQALNLDQLHQATAIEREQISKAIEKLQSIHREGVSGIVLSEVAGGWQFRTDPGSAEYVRRFLQVKPQRLTRAAVETLAIIAYRQPVTRPEIEDIRGVDSGAVLKALLDRKLIKILGKKDEVGRPMLYGTTREFLEFFALKDLSALPTLREFHELTQEHQEIVEQETAPKPTAEGTVALLADPDFQAKLEASTAKTEAALEELEAAISSAEETTRTAHQILNPPKVPAEGESGSPGESESTGVEARAAEVSELEGGGEEKQREAQAIEPEASGAQPTEAAGVDSQGAVGGGRPARGGKARRARSRAGESAATPKETASPDAAPANETAANEVPSAEAAASSESPVSEPGSGATGSSAAESTHDALDRGEGGDRPGGTSSGTTGDEPERSDT